MKLNQNMFIRKRDKLIIGILSLYTLLAVCMGIATFLEKTHGQAFAATHIYGAWWFIGLWAALSLLSVVVLLRRKVQQRPAVFLLHGAFLVILLGALVTHLFAREGTLHLRVGQTATAFTLKDGRTDSLPFSVRLLHYETLCYPGTDAPMDYRARLLTWQAGRTDTLTVSMNRIGRQAGYRFCQSSYDSDQQGTVLLVASDPYGIGITYAGYLLLLLGWLWTFCAQGTRLRHLARLALRVLLPAVLLVGSVQQAQAADIPREIADDLAEVAVLYDGRICPLHTAMTDYLTKLSGKDTWQGKTASEVFVGWMIFYNDWEGEQLIKVKDAAVQRLLGINGSWASVRDFYTAQHAYKLEGKVNDPSLPESTRKALREADEKLRVVTLFYQSELLRIFPLQQGDSLHWHAPGSTELPRGVPAAEFQFVHHAMDRLVQAILTGDTAGAHLMIAKIKAYQQAHAAHVLPSRAKMRAEIWLNHWQQSRPVVFLALGASLLLCLAFFAGRPRRWLNVAQGLLLVLLTLWVTLLMGLRWWVSGHVPMTNGYETMLLMAWLSLMLGLLCARALPILRALAPVVAGCCMLVAHLASGTPRITALMPVLASPLLSLHVALVMMAYVLLVILALIAVRCLLLRPRKADEQLLRLTALSRLLLYPAVALLSAGIFVGAVWANISWGSYWSWDPKETWALITLMVYAVPLHGLPRTDSPRAYHIYILLALLTVLMTYFGVNYFLSGMHAYS